MQLSRNPFLLAPLVALACGGNGSTSIDGGSDGMLDGDAVLIDAEVDANEGTGQRLGGSALGVREPVRITATLGSIRRHVLVTEDGGFQLPGKLESGLAYDITVDSARCRIVDGSGTIGAEDVTSVKLYCIGVVQLADLVVAPPAALTMPVRGDTTSAGLTRPFFATDADPLTLTPRAAYPGVPTITIAGNPAAHDQPITLSSSGPVVSIVLSHSSGLAETYRLDASNRAPAQEAYVKAHEQLGQMQFSSGTICASMPVGTGVALGGDTLVVGAPCASSLVGAAYVYRRAGGGWSYEATLPIPAAAPLVAGDRFGGAVAIEGNTIVVGAAGNDNPAGPFRGKVYVYERIGTTWTFTDLLQASNGANGDLFGREVAISGTTIAVGAPRANIANNGDAGAAYVFVKSGTWTEQAALKASSAVASAQVGFSIAISGDTLVAGAPSEGGGAVHIFTRSGSTWSAPTRIAGSGFFGWDVSIDGDQLAIGAPSAIVSATSRGAAHVYRRTTGWTLDATVFATTPDTDDNFGHGVHVDRTNLIVGAPSEDGASRAIDGAHNNNALNAGAAYAFRRAATGWDVTHYIKASNADPGDQFGASVAADGDTFVVGASDEKSAATDVGGDQLSNSASLAGAVYVFR